MEVLSLSAAETQKLAYDLAKTLTPPVVIGLSGALGSGKTTFVQGLAQGLGITRRILSPTFVFVRQYHFTSELFGGMLYHVDLYRAESEADVQGIGLEDMLADQQAIVVIEWPERAKGLLSRKRIEVNFEYLDQDKRKIVICHVG